MPPSTDPKPPAATRVRIRVLGGLEVAPVLLQDVPDRLANQPKRVALLAYLALSHPGAGHRRDHLLGVFWPDADAARGRNALSQLLHQLRRLLGPDALSRDGGETIRLDLSVVDVDAARFVDAVSAQRDQEALALYTGDLLPGFFISGAPEFEQWLETTRARLRGLARASAGRLVQQHVAAGRLSDAEAVAARLVDLDPLDEQAVRTYMACAERAGHRADALRAYDALAQRLAQDLEAAPSDETRELAERIRRDPVRRTGEYAVIAPPAKAPDVVPAESPADAPDVGAPIRRPDAATHDAATRDTATHDSADAQATGLRRRPWRPLGLVLAGAALVTIVSAMRSEPTVPVDAERVAVLPFDADGAAPEIRYLGEGMMDLLTVPLARDPGSRTADPSAIVSMVGHELPAGHTRGDTAGVRVARALGAGRVVLGRVSGAARRFVVTAELRDVVTRTTIASATVDGPIDSLPWMVDALAHRLRAGAAGESPTRFADLMSASPAALARFIAGRSAFRRGRFLEATRAYAEAVRIDTLFAVAALEGARSSRWSAQSSRLGPVVDSLFALARRHADHLSKADQAYLEAARTQFEWTNAARQVRNWSHALGWYPAASDVRFEMADALLHEGGAAGRPFAREQARNALRALVRDDSTFEPALYHLLDEEHLAGDLAAVARLRDRFLAVEPGSDIAPYVRWRAAVALRDEAGRRTALAALDSAPVLSLLRIVNAAQLDGIGMADAALALAAAGRRAPNDPDARRLRWELAPYYWATRGRPDSVRRSLAEIASLVGEDDLRVFQAASWITSALYAHGDSALAADALRAIRTPAVPWRDPFQRRLGTCWDALWTTERAAEPEAKAAAALAARLALPMGASTSGAKRLVVCQAMVAAASALRFHRSDAAGALARLDALLDDDPYDSRLRLVAAALHGRAAQYDRALGLVARERIPYVGWAGMWAHRDLLVLEAEFARRLGDTVRVRRVASELRRFEDDS